MADEDVERVVSIVVPCRNEADHIETLLRSILAQETPPGGFEVIVADGMSDDGTRNILSKLAKENSPLRVVDNPGGIVATGLNTAIRLARGKIIIRMDAHTIYARDYAVQCVQVLRESAAQNVVQSGHPARHDDIDGRFTHDATRDRARSVEFPQRILCKTRSRK